MHFAMEAGVEPSHEASFGVAELYRGEADLVKAELLPPVANTVLEVSPLCGSPCMNHEGDDRPAPRPNQPVAAAGCNASEAVSTGEGWSAKAELTWPLSDEAATRSLGGRLATALQAGMSVWLSGELGAGKTTLVRGVLQALHYDGRVKSPTYTLVELYPLVSFNLYHFDLYRFADPLEWEEAGFRDYFNEHSVCFVEWPEKAQERLPEPDLVIRLEFAGEGRMARLTGRTEVGRRCLEQLQA